MGSPPVLFIPGTLCTRAIFETLAGEFTRLAPSVDVVQFALEDSISEMADAAIKKISIQDGAAIVGFSMGGMVAMEIVRKAPQRVRKLALLNSNYHCDLPERRSGRLAHLEQARTQGMEHVIRTYFLDRYLYRVDPENGDLIVKMACELGIGCFEAQVKALTSRPDSSSTLKTIECPTLVLGAMQDELCPADVQQRMHRLIGHSELVMLEDCGHFSMLEKPDRVKQVLRNWYLSGQSR